MRVLIHDLPARQFQALFPAPPADLEVVGDDGTIRPCAGCFGCWVKTPGRCVLRDGYEDMGALLAGAETVLLFSRCCWGGYSPFVKNVLDRSISYLLPFFRTVGRETHHRPRYPHPFRLEVYFYGETAAADRETARALAAANAVNFCAASWDVTFVPGAGALREVLA